jgi:hypothetical protein
MSSNSISCDHHGHIILTGLYGSGDTLNFTTPKIIPTIIHACVFVAKLDNNGNGLWLKTIVNSSGDSWAYSIANDKADNSVITGNFTGNLKIDSINLTQTNNTGTVFLAKFDSTGNTLWAIKSYVPSNLMEVGYSVAIDDSNKVYCTGEFHGKIAFGNDTITSLQPGLCNIFIAKFNASGNCIWGKAAGTIGSGDQGNAIATDKAGNIVVTGFITGSDTGHFDTHVIAPLNTAAPWNFFVAKIGNTQITDVKERSVQPLSISIYPDPSKDFIHVAGIKDKNFNIQIYNSVGQLVIEKNSLNTTENINIQSLLQGLYFIDITTNNQETIVKKFIKE